MSLKRETSLLDLNDDCLFETFSCLSLLDLCAIRNSCSRMRNVADNYVGRTHKSLNTNYGCTSIENDVHSAIAKEELLQILSSFGQQIDALTLDQDDFTPNVLSDAILSMLDAFCKRRRLQHLKLKKIEFSDEFVANCTHPFANVGRLTLEKCTSYTASSMDECIKKCTGLADLEIIYGSIDGTFLEQAYPTLRRFCVESNRIDSELVKNFIARNKELNELRIVQCHETDDSIFKSIADHLNELETLTLRTILVTPNYKYNLMELLNVAKLRDLEIDCNYEAIDDFLKGLAVKDQLHSLGLASVELTEDVCIAIGNLKNLQKLKLVTILNSMKSGQFKSIAAQLPNLKKLEIASSDLVTFDDIVEFVENAPKLTDIILSSCKNVIPFDMAQFNRLVDVCVKRPIQLKLTVHIDYYALHSMKKNIKRPLRRQHAKIVELIELAEEKKDFTALEMGMSGYFAEESGALDYDEFGDEFDEYDDYDEYDGYSDFDDYVSDEDEIELIRMNYD